jgi:hypothetical protein
LGHLRYLSWLMTSPLPLPDWVPWWVHLAILLILLAFGLMFVLMPFSMIGVRGRLEAIDARLDEIQGEIRSLSLRLPEPSDEEDLPRPTRQQIIARPPIPPAPMGSGAGRSAPPRAGRTEPRLY